MSKPNYDALHRLDTLPLRGKGKRLHVLVAYLFPTPLPSPKRIAEAVRVLAQYKRGALIGSAPISHDPLDLHPTQYGIFREKLRKDIRKGRSEKPIVCWNSANGTLYILDGHHRVAAALLTGRPEVDVIVV